MSDPISTGARASGQVRLGELDAGPVALGSRGGVATLEDNPRPGSTTTVSWWIGAEDRWHRPDSEASTRDRLPDGAPVMETMVRIPGGDAVGRLGVGRVNGIDRPSVVVDVQNSSPVPVAFAYVVSSSEPLSVDAGGVDVIGVGRFSLTRRALGFVSADSLDELLALIESGRVGSSSPDGASPGAAALLVPLPHTARAVATFTPAGTSRFEPTQAPLDRQFVPAPSRIVAGWASHRSVGPRFELADDRHEAALAAATCDVLMGVARDSGDPVLEGRVAEAQARLGRIEQSTGLLDLVRAQRPDGAVPGDDPVGATAQLLRTAAAWWSGGASPAFADTLVWPVATAANWLAHRKRADEVTARRSDVVPALASVVPMLADLGQHDAAADLIAFADRLEPRRATPTTGATAGSMLAALGDGLSWAGPDGRPDVGASADFVLASLDGIVRETPDGLELASGWLPEHAGTSIEAHEIPTRWGVLSYGIRWHGDRPALLWELRPWDDRPAAGPPRLTAPAIDADWSTSDSSGDALLAARPPNTDAPDAANFA